jgi:hypothetical protein
MIGVIAAPRTRQNADIRCRSFIGHRSLAIVASLVTATVACGLVTQTAAAQQVVVSGSGTFASAPPDYTGLATGPFSFSFLLPQNPTPDFSIPILFNFASASGAFTQGTTTVNEAGRLTFFTSDFDGGMSFRVFVTDVDADGTDLLDSIGPTMFTGSTADPVFTPGTYSGFTTEEGSVGSLASVSITTTPEPGTVGLLIAGLLGLIPGVRFGRLRRSGTAG